MHLKKTIYSGYHNSPQGPTACGGPIYKNHRQLHCSITMTFLRQADQAFTTKRAAVLLDATRRLAMDEPSELLSAGLMTGQDHHQVSGQRVIIGNSR
jgi:hypothetical protein